MHNADFSLILEEEIKKLPLSHQPIELYEPIKYILTLGGKRLRPRLTLLSCALFSDDIKPAIPAALAIETFHNFTLIHDDIMDNADKRRGKSTVHKKWNINVAILSGDAMCILAYQLLSQIPTEKLAIVLTVFNDIALKVCEGQQYDMNFEGFHNVSEQEYLKMIELKTATLIAGSLKIGALIGNASMENSQLLYNMGINMGLAFQLQDDLLDTFGDEKLLGKEVGKDIVANKKTYLLIKAWELASEKQRDELNYLLNHPHVKASDKISRVKQIFKDLKIEQLTQQIIEHYFMAGIECLKNLKVPDIRKQDLISVLDGLNHRRF